MSTPVYAFYGFKGGTGRSFVLAHVAALLASHGKKVLLIDADLEAPGLGDFYDTPGRATFKSWRGSDGLMDAMRELAQDVRTDLSLTDAKLEAHVRQRLQQLLDETSGSLVPLSFRQNQNGGLLLEPFLLGPGNHAADRELGGQAYVANFLDFDWNAFLSRGGTDLLAILGEYWRSGSHGFDHVLIDARTGYNLPSMLLLQHWATHIIGVGSWSFQSIDGLARMLPVARAGHGEGRTRLPAAIVMNKTLQEDPQKDVQDVQKHKSKLVARYAKQGLAKNYATFELPYCGRLQTNDRMVFAELSWEEFASFRTSGEKKGKSQEAEMCVFLSKVGELLGWLTNGDCSLPQDNVLQSTFESFRPVVKNTDTPQITGPFEDTTEYLTPEEEDIRRIEKIARTYVYPDDRRKDVADDDDSASGSGQAILGDALERFMGLSKEGRALTRNRLLELLNEERESSDEERAWELYEHFSIGIDPTTAMSDAVKSSREAPKKRTEDRASEIHTAIRLTYTNPQSDDWKAATKELAKRGEQESQLAAFLGEFVKVVDPESALKLDALTGFALQMKDLIERNGPGIPKTWDGFGRWNLYDLLDLLTSHLSVILRRQTKPDAAPNGTAFAALGHAVHDRLADSSAWKNQKERDQFDRKIRCRFQWLEYFTSACALLERADASWQGLSVDRADVLRGGLDLPPPEAVADWNWISLDSVCEEDLDQLSLHAISLNIEALTIGKGSKTAHLAQAAIARALENAMTVLHGNPEAAEPELRWATCLRALYTSAESAPNHDLGFRLSRRMNRLLRHVPNNNLTKAASNIGLASMDALDFYSDPDIWAEHHGDSSKDDELSDTRKILTAAIKAKTGLVREARDILAPFVNEISEKSPNDTWAAQVDTVLKFQVYCCEKFGDLEGSLKSRIALRSMPGGGVTISLRSRRKNHWADILHTAHAAALLEDWDRFDQQIAQLDEIDENDAQATHFNAIRNLMVALRSGEAIDFETELKRGLERLVSLLPAGPDRGACEWAGLDWHGSGLVTDGQPALPSIFGIENLHAIAIEGAIRAGREAVGSDILERWNDLARRMTLPADRMTPFHHTLAAYRSAFNARYGQTSEKTNALYHRDADLAVNGDERAFAYNRIFELCGIEPSAPPQAQ